MQHGPDSDLRSAAVRVAGALVGLGLVFAAVSPFQGVPPRGGSGAAAPAQLEVRVLGAGELEIDPLGVVMEPTAFPAPGARGGPALSVTVRNITAFTQRVSLRLVGLSPTLGKAVKVRGSVAGAVAVNGPLGTAAEWTKPVGRLRSGQQTTLRMRFKLLEGVPPDAWRGQLDVRQLELRTERVDGSPPADGLTTSARATTPGATTPTTPASATTPTVPSPSTPPATTSEPTGGVAP